VQERGVIVWVDATAGASGDMLLGALVDAGVDLGVIRAAVDAIAPERVELTSEAVRRGGLAATHLHVSVADSTTERTWADIRSLLEDSALDDAVKASALKTFKRLAEAEARVHGTDIDGVHFHEVGALDAIADVVGVCAGFLALGAERIVVSPIAVGWGRVAAAHGDMPVPVPAVAELLRGFASQAGPGVGESCTPTGAALLTTLGDHSGAQPPMVVERIGVGAGTRDPDTHANVVRILIGEPANDKGGVGAPLLLESNIDDMDPRLWPPALAALLAAGASDAWLTPILMKKGRPAHTLSVLVAADRATAVREAIFRNTTTIGLREQTVGKTALDRAAHEVVVEGQRISIKVASWNGVVMNAQPEYEDVVRAAETIGRPIKEVMALAVAAHYAVR
jgi:hypothetical protein